MGAIEDALAALEAQKDGETVSIQGIADRFGVERSTLSRRWRGITHSRAEQYQNRQLLSSIQEQELLQYIDKLTKRGLPPTRSMIRNFAGDIVRKPIGRCWADRFVKRHRIDLISKYTNGIDIARKRADSAFKYSLYFELLVSKIQQYNIMPSLIYNMDEKGFLIGILSKQKRIFSKSRYENGGIR
jgi:AcrR family transcriptional regulator